MGAVLEVVGVADGEMTRVRQATECSFDEARITAGDVRPLRVFILTKLAELLGQVYRCLSIIRRDVAREIGGVRCGVGGHDSK